MLQSALRQVHVHSVVQMQAITLYAISNCQGRHIIGVVQFVRVSDKKEVFDGPPWQAVSRCGQEVLCRTLLFLACLVADGRPQVHLFAVGQGAAHGTHQNSQTRLLEDMHVVVVCVAHCPSWRVTLCFLAGRRIHQPAVSVCPLLPPVVLADLYTGFRVYSLRLTSWSRVIL